jgi:alkylation response protein AidB-like acyl-CoA dehydrogenase
MVVVSNALPDWPDFGDVSPQICSRLAAADGPADAAGVWSEPLWQVLRDAGATRWSLPARFGGEGADRSTILCRYARVAEYSLTAAFVLTQHDAGVRRLAPAAERGSHLSAAEWLERIAAGTAFTTVGISQLTTSRRHGASAVIATETSARTYRLDGIIPWVTGAPRADMVVIGAVTSAGEQLLIALPTDRSGVAVRAPFELAALQASCTSEISCAAVPVEAIDVLAGPSPDVMATPGQAGTGGLETSALALGQARAALVALESERAKRDGLDEPIEALAETWSRTAVDLLAAAAGRPDAPAPAQVRAQANALVLRATQAYLTARKGTGFLRAEPAQRWARQALFFLVWSCPTPVAQAAIRDLAGICPA